MARAKADNLGRDQYAALVAAELAAELIVSAEQDAPGLDEIVLEAVGEENWDDIVLRRSTGAHPNKQVNWQVKRQQTPLDTKIFGAALTGWIARHTQATSTGSPVPSFRFGVASLGELAISKSKTLELRHLYSVCARLSHDQVDCGQCYASSHEPEKEWVAYIASAIGEPDQLATTALLQSLRIERLGLEGEIRRRGSLALSTRYERPDDMFQALYAYLAMNTEPSLRFDYSALVANVLSRGIRCHSATPWTRITRLSVGTDWELRGTQDQKKVAAGFWGKGATVLKVQVRPSRAMGEEERALARMMVHRGSASQLRLDDERDWLDRIQSLTGGTIGSQPRVAPHFQATSLDKAQSTVATTTEPQEVVARDLKAQMDSHFHSEVRRSVENALLDPSLLGLSIAPDLLKPMCNCWSAWAHRLEQEPSLREHLFKTLLATDAEWQRLGFDAAVRVGGLNVEICTYALLVGLAIHASTPDIDLSMSASTANLAWGTGEVHLVALAYVSTGDARGPRRVALAGPDLLLRSRSLTIVAGSSDLAEQVADYSAQVSTAYSSDGASKDSFQNLYAPTPILTASVRFLQAMESGIAAVRDLIRTTTIMEDPTAAPSTPEEPKC